MQHIRLILATLALFVCNLALAQELNVLSPSTPQLAAVQEWHRALAVGDFGAYKRSIDETQSTARADFDELRRHTPRLVKVTAPRAVSGGNFELTAVGCKDARRQATSILVVKSANNRWKIRSNGWAPFSGDDAQSCAG